MISLILCVFTDKFDKCELECAYDYAEFGSAKVTSCQDGCAKTKSKCVDTPEAIACFNCALACSATYDQSLKKCLLEVPRTMTYTTEYSHCEKSASDIMSSCINKCSPNAVA